MKKLIAFLMAAVLLTAASTTAFAAEINQDSDPKTSEATVKTSIAPTYTVSIPESVKVSMNETQKAWGSIEVKHAQIDPNWVIKVDLACDGTLNNLADNTKTIPYSVEDTNGIFTTASYLKAGDSTALTIKIAQSDWNKAYAGDYSDTVTFTVSYVSASN